MKNKKGFTIVELVIVIAVIAILAAVLIPTFSGVIGKANSSARTQEFTNALKVVLAGNAETGALAENTIFVNSEKQEVASFAVYNGNKLGDITAAKDGETALLSSTAISGTDAVSNAITFKTNKDDAGTSVTVYSVIVPFADGQPNTDSLTALGSLFGGTAAYSAGKVTITKDANVLTLNCYSNLDLAKGMFVISPTK